MSVEEKRRELFESVIESVIGFRLDKAVYAGGVLASQYQAPTMQAAWVGFNAALDAVVIELPISNFPDGCGDIYEAIEIDSMREAIESTGLGLKVKS